MSAVAPGTAAASVEPVVEPVIEPDVDVDVDVDVVVIGAGPVGATLALLLTRLGHRVEIWESRHEPSSGPGASAVESAHETTLAPAGIWGRMALHPMQSVAVTLRAGAAPLRLAPPSPFVKFEQQQFRAASWAALDACANLSFRRGLRLLAFEEGRPGTVEVIGCLQPPGGEAHDRHGTAGGKVTTTARWVVGCDGPASLVRQQLGASFDEVAPAQPWLFAEGTARRHDLEVNHIVADPTRPGTWFAIPGERVRLEALLRPDERDPERLRRLAETLVDEWIGEPVQLDRVEAIAMHARIASHWQRGGVFIAGDAAHQLPFYLGRGLGLGLSDAAALAWRITAARSGDGGPLGQYSQDRSAEANEQLANTLSLGALAYTFDLEAARARDAFLADNDVTDVLQLAHSSHRDLAALSAALGRAAVPGRDLALR